MKLLLHICCAPCSVAIVDKLRNDSDILFEGFSIILIFIRWKSMKGENKQ